MVWSNKVMIVLDKLLSVIYLNVLWLIGSVIGLGIFGVFPATYAMNALMKKEEFSNDFPSFRKLSKEFFVAYKHKFLKMNGIGIIYFLVLYVLWIDLQLVRGMTVGAAIFYYPVLFFIIYVLATLIYTFPVALYTRGSFKEKAKLVMTLPLLLPFQTICSLLFFMVLLAVAYKFSIIIPLLLMSTYFLCIDKFLSGELIKKGIIRGMENG
ncbi:MAG TPA: DUF624 domain-containing protein [Niallia sp.]|nr:DUF624 domain-containing protein [Niallia sp.]